MGPGGGSTASEAASSNATAMGARAARCKDVVNAIFSELKAATTAAHRWVEALVAPESDWFDADGYGRREVAGARRGRPGRNWP